MQNFTLTKAKRESVKLKIGLTGPSGSGKTYSALKMAYGITGDWKKIVVADTENKSALYYAGEITSEDWQHIDFTPPYDPRRWEELIEYVEKMEGVDVLILDSASHEWEGEGGCLDLLEKVVSKKQKGVNSFTGWKIVTPLHKKFVDKLLHSNIHIIATMRTKTAYEVEKDDGGKISPKKLGLKANQREGLEYEFGIVFDIEDTHFCTASKDRTNLFANAGPFMITEDTGTKLLNWAESGVEAKPRQMPTASKPNPKDEPYKGKIVQRKALFEVFTKYKVEKDDMKEIAEMLIVNEVKMSELDAAVKEIIEDSLLTDDQVPLDQG